MNLGKDSEILVLCVEKCIFAQVLCVRKCNDSMVSYVETVRFKRRNTSFHPVKRTDTSQSCFRPIGKEFWFTRKQIQLLLHND